MKKLFFLLLCVVVITEPSGQRDRSSSLTTTRRRDRSSSLTGGERSSSLTPVSRVGGQGEEGERNAFAFKDQGETAMFGGGLFSSGEGDDEGDDWMDVDPETLFAAAVEGGSASAKKTGTGGVSASASAGFMPAQQDLFNFQVGGDVLFAPDGGNLFGGFDLGSDAFKILAPPADDHHAVSSAAASGQDSEALARRPQKRGKASGLVVGGPQDVDIMDALTQQLAETTIQSVEEDSEELKLLDRAVNIVQNHRSRNPQDQGAVADLKALHSLRPQCVRALKRIEELFFMQEDSVTEAQSDRIDIEIGQNEEALEEIEKQVRAMLEKYQKPRRRRKKGGKAKANKASGSQSARGGSSAGGSSGAAAAF